MAANAGMANLGCGVLGEEPCHGDSRANRVCVGGFGVKLCSLYADIYVRCQNFQFVMSVDIVLSYNKRFVYKEL